jgi:hypothetical protein
MDFHRGRPGLDQHFDTEHQSLLVCNGARIAPRAQSSRLENSRRCTRTADCSATVDDLTDLSHKVGFDDK